MIAIIGTGRIGGAFGKTLSSLGFKILYGSRNPSSDNAIALVKNTGNESAAAYTKEAINRSDIVILATPYTGMADTLSQIERSSDKIFIDVTNALKMSEDGLMSMASKSSAGEEWQSALPDAKIVKAFNTVGFHIVADPQAAPGPVSVMLASDHVDAKETVANIATKMGFETVDLGPLRQSRYMEGMAALYLTPYLQGRIADAFEFHLRSGTSPAKSKGVRAAQ